MEFNDHLEEFKHKLEVNPFIGIDMIIELASQMSPQELSSHKTEILSNFSQAVLLSQKVDKNTWNNDPIAELFRREQSHHIRQFIGVCLLRLLSVCDQCFQIEPFNHKAFDLFDNVFQNDIYKYCNINKGDQTYIKERSLKDIVPSVEQEITNTINSLNNLSSIANSSFRKAFLEAIKSKRAQLIIFPFLPQNSSNPLSLRINEIFITIENYLKEPESRIFQAFGETKEILQNYLEEVKNHGTKYSVEYLGGVLKRLLELLELHFRNSAVSKPAHLSIMKQDKKYPTSTRNITFNLGINVRNEGPGHAFDIFLTVLSDLSLKKSEIYLGHLAPTSTNIDIPASIDEPMHKAYIMGELSWRNFDGSESTKDFSFELEGQRTDIDWESLEEDNPYDLEPVSTEDDLVGRTEILNNLIAQSKAKSVGSSFIYGQKRVGKTSIAKTLKTRLSSSYATPYLVIYLETGDYKDPDARTTIENLGRRLCREIKRANSAFSQLPIPEFKGSLSPLTDFLESVLDIDPECKILFILDEFDEIPKELYRRSPIGDAFFLTIRSISGKPSFGFILVGGEKMEYILNNQGERLNKFGPERVDYFDREKSWSDFKDLVQRPVLHLLEISDAAFTTLYEQTAGNPYFTKLICHTLFKLLVNRRDSHATNKEVEEAIRQTLQTVGSNSFQHFWEDGIVDTEERVEEKIMIRRQILLALAETLDKQLTAQKEVIITQAVRKGLTELIIEIELQDFVRRQILLKTDNVYQCKVPFFGKWLQERGIREIISTYADPALVAKSKQEEEEAFVRPEEIVNLLKQKEFYYKGKTLTEEKIRAWLNQFRTNIEQRYIFRILQNFVFYNHSTIRVRLAEAHDMVRAASTRHLKHRGRKREDIFISYLDGLGKSGASYASLYAEQAEIIKGNIIEQSKLKTTLERIIQNTSVENRPHSLVFIDDFIGTGESACKYFRQLYSVCGDLLRKSQLRIFFIAISGFEQGKHKLEDLLDELALDVKVRVCDLLDETDKCFSDSSKVFPGVLERETAKNIVTNYGHILVPQHALGFGDCQAAIAFEDGCPNNTLPIFWSDAKDWIPLFRRD